jgi:hypothetical protein
MVKLPIPCPLGYVTAVAGVALATAGRLALSPVLGPHYPFVTYLFTLLLTVEASDGDVQFDRGLPDRPSEKSFSQGERGRVTRWVAEVRGEDTLAAWWIGPYAIGGGRDRPVGPKLVSAILRFEATSIPCGSDEVPTLQCEG